jgi:hypothetical protein
MAELLGVLIRGLVVLVGHVVSALDLYALWEGRRRRGRLAALARGERAEIPCVLRDPALTGGRHRQGWLSVGDPPVTWRAKDATESVVFAPGPLTMEAVDQKAVTFRSEGGRTELHLHPDEAPPVLQALGGPGPAAG